MVDVGGPCGALIVFAPESMLGAEIEIRPRDRDWVGTHTAIRRRDLRDAVAFAGVFGSILGGEYELRLLGADGRAVGDGADLAVTVGAGGITQVRWPGDATTAP